MPLCTGGSWCCSQAVKPFYMRLNDDGQTVACFDFLVRAPAR